MQIEMTSLQVRHVRSLLRVMYREVAPHLPEGGEELGDVQELVDLFNEALQKHLAEESVQLLYLAPQYTDLRKRIAAAMEGSVWDLRFIPTRYPHTYAYDFLRTHHQDFDIPIMMSRSDAAAWLRGYAEKGGLDLEVAKRMLADAYLTEHQIDKED